MFTQEDSMLGVAVTVYRMWRKMLIRILTFFPHLVHLESALWLMALTMMVASGPEFQFCP